MIKSTIQVTLRSQRFVQNANVSFFITPVGEFFSFLAIKPENSKFIKQHEP